MSSKHIINDGPVELSGDARMGSGSPTWWLVFVRELNELWMGGKAPILLLIYSVLLGIMTYVMASNSELSLIPPQEMVYETLKAAIAVGLFISMIIGADAISGERERSTLESLLLTPTSRTQIVFGKFLAAISPWPVTLAITIPYLKVLSQGDAVFEQAVPWGALLGTALSPAFTAMGMLASFWSNSNKTSLFTGLGIYILFLLPTQLPGKAQTGTMGSLLQQVNPIAAANHFLSKVLTNNRTAAEFWDFLVAPVAFALLVYVLLFWYASPSLRLEGGKSSKFWTSMGRLIGFSVVACLMITLSTSPAMAQEEGMATERSSIQITVDMAYKTVQQGEHIIYNTTVTNNGTENSAPLCLAMNIINLDAAGDIVDPEDWSPQRTQYIETLAPGQSATHAWRVNAILDGDYLIYMVAIPEPSGDDATSQVVASSGIHLIVTPFTKLNPGGVLPYAIGGPVVLIACIIILYRLRRRKIDMGGATAGS
ncbi:ABC transporter permease [candidate division KSB1 bacterium]|nr:ABC transporter permease [candidate division KSB1 bacterium]